MMQPATKWMVRSLVVAVALAALASSAFAAQNVANPAQKGSLLIFPLIDVRDGNTTVVRIANDANIGVDVKCYYVNETKARRDFEFRLTKKQAMSWNAKTGVSDPADRVPPFPTISGGLGGNPFLGELICFAVNVNGSHQISHNHLSGTATVGLTTDPENGIGTAGSYEYNSWNFVARGVARGVAVGTAGRLDLTGADNAYDACPQYNILHFSPRATVPGGASDYRIGMSSCLQDLRQDFTPHFTKLQFEIWNAQEVKFTGSWECADSVESFLLSTLDRLPDNTSFGVLGTDAAHALMRGVKSTQCSGSEATGLLAVIARVVTDGEGDEIPLHGTTTNHAGVSPTPGFVLWDPQDDVVAEKAAR